MCAILVAAGRGTRMGQPKQLLQLGDRPVAAWSLAVLSACATIRDIIIACEPDDAAAFEALGREIGANKVRALVPGGMRRQDSVFSALQRVPADAHIVVVHDGARPFVRADLLQAVIDGAARAGACIAAVPVKDTIKEVNQHAIVLRTIPRERLWAAQTPQAFDYQALYAAHQHAEAAGFVGTDDAEIVERFGGVMPAVVESSYENLKITTPDDLFIADKILAARRSGNPCA